VLLTSISASNRSEDLGMGSERRRRTRVVVGFLALLVAVGVLVVGLARITRNGRREVLTLSKPSPPPINSGIVVSTPTQPTPDASSPLPVPASPVLPTPEVALPNNLIVPVAGLRPDQLRDTFTESRSEGRVHDAIDIAAPLGTPVLAAAEGTIIKLFHSERGGTTIYQLSTDQKFIYYYAHLDRYAEGLTEGHLARQGETIGYVGDSGNAGAGNYHLHFSVALVSDPKRYWEGVNINPYPLLKR
jgi:murein DD-endopeptidase MepM/ murein hydrolase activator NlpD